jgi:hypothetical protein
MPNPDLEDRMNMKMDEFRALYGDIPVVPPPFTREEITELDDTRELLVYVPANLSMAEMASRWDIPCNVDFASEKMIRNAMTNESHWYIASASRTPELLYLSGQKAKRIYEDEGLHGMDVRRYLAFVATYRQRFGELPDRTYWTFLLSGSYDRSGVSIIGFDSHGVLSHHGWMRDFRAKFVGSRYVVLPPRIEVVPETAQLKRAYRGRDQWVGREASTD